MDCRCAATGLGRLPGIHEGVSAHLQEPVWVAAVELLEHPAFVQAMLMYCRSMSEPGAFRWPSNKIFAQRMRYITCYILIGLAARFEQGIGPVPTMTLLQSMAPGSPRQVSDLISGLRARGYVTAQQNASDRREARLCPTAPLVFEVARSPLTFLKASELLVEGETAPLQELLIADVDRLSHMIALSTEAFQTKDVLFSTFSTVLEFTGRDSGYLILCSIIGAHLASLAGQAWDFPLSYDALSRRFQVSRQHVGNILAEGTKQGLFTIQGGRVRQIDALLLREFAWWSAGQMAHFRMMASEVLPADVAQKREFSGVI
jgi:hypothetical protein